MRPTSLLAVVLGAALAWAGAVVPGGPAHAQQRPGTGPETPQTRQQPREQPGGGVAVSPGTPTSALPGSRGAEPGRGAPETGRAAPSDRGSDDLGEPALAPGGGAIAPGNRGGRDSGG